MRPGGEGGCATSTDPRSGPVQREGLAARASIPEGKKRTSEAVQPKRRTPTQCGQVLRRRPRVSRWTIRRRGHGSCEDADDDVSIACEASHDVGLARNVTRCSEAEKVPTLADEPLQCRSSERKYGNMGVDVEKRREKGWAGRQVVRGPWHWHNFAHASCMGNKKQTRPSLISHPLRT